MGKHKSKYNFRQIINDRYKLVVLHEDSFEEKASFTGKLWYWVTSLITIAAVITILTIIFIKLTPLREYVIGTSFTGDQRAQLIDAYTRIDSMERIAMANEVYLENLQNVLSGNVGETMKEVLKRSETEEQGTEQTGVTGDISSAATVSEDEMALRELVESGAPYDIAENQSNKTTGISSYTFYSPIKGVISSKYSPQEQHYAVDIAVKQNEPVRSTLSGHVIFASYTPETGYVVIVQHANSLLSQYKHCSSIIKKVGNFVKSGEVIAFAGNTGDLSTGPHLHFELWNNGRPIDPTDYIAF